MRYTPGMTDSQLPHKYIALDVGSVRIGVAAADRYGVTTYGVAVIDARQGERVFAQIEEQLRRNEADAIIVGVPRTLAGKDSAQTLKILEFIEQLRAWFTGKDVHIDTWDESLTTVEAERLLLEGDMSRSKRKKKIDALAAAIMLRSYLDGRRLG